MEICEMGQPGASHEFILSLFKALVFPHAPFLCSKGSPHSQPGVSPQPRSSPETKRWYVFPKLAVTNAMQRVIIIKNERTKGYAMSLSDMKSSNFFCVVLTPDTPGTGGRGRATLL